MKVCCFWVPEQDRKTAKPNEAWRTDITYIHTKNGFGYLAAVMDDYTRKIIGWTKRVGWPVQLTHAPLFWCDGWPGLAPRTPLCMPDGRPAQLRHILVF